MASSLSFLARRAVGKFLQPKPSTGPMMAKRLQSVFTESGGLTEMPVETRFSLLKTLATVCPFLYAGATLSKNGAAFLEENDIFVPDDDDD